MRKWHLSVRKTLTSDELWSADIHVWGCVETRSLPPANQNIWAFRIWKVYQICKFLQIRRWTSTCEQMSLINSLLGFLCTRISGYSPFKILKVLHISKVRDNFCIYWCEFHICLSKVHLRSKCPVTKFGPAKTLLFSKLTSVDSRALTISKKCNRLTIQP